MFSRRSAGKVALFKFSVRLEVKSVVGEEHTFDRQIQFLTGIVHYAHRQATCHLSLPATHGKPENKRIRVYS